jgi:hypothetical protein
MCPDDVEHIEGKRCVKRGIVLRADEASVWAARALRDEAHQSPRGYSLDGAHTDQAESFSGP